MTCTVTGNTKKHPLIKGVFLGAYFDYCRICTQEGNCSYLKEFGIDYAQGYFIGKPAPVLLKKKIRLLGQYSIMMQWIKG